MSEVPPWGRENRRVRRETARELAKGLMHSGGATHTSRLHVVLWFLETFMALGLLLVAPKIGRSGTAIVLILMVVCLAHPVWQLNLVQKAPSATRRRLAFFSIMLIALLLLTVFAVYVWPPIRRHHLTEKEWNDFEEPLKAQTAEREEIGILCPTDDEGTCVYAQQFVNIFRDAGWKVTTNKVQRVVIGSPVEGVTVYKQGTGKLDESNWRSGLWVAQSPSLLSVFQAFENIGVEPDSGANPEMPTEAIDIYFGAEKENQAEKTAVTNLMRQYRSGQLPVKPSAPGVSP